MRIEIGDDARADLAEILAHGVEAFGRHAAEAYLCGLDRAILRLADYPFSAPLHTFVDPPIRALTYRSHRIFYDVTDDCVFLRRVLHTAMDSARWL